MPSARSVEYPEHEKLHAVQEKSQAIGEFLEWVAARHEAVLAAYSYDDNENWRMYPFRTPKEELLAEFFDINLKALEAEKRLMLQRERERR